MNDFVINVKKVQVEVKNISIYKKNVAFSIYFPENKNNDFYFISCAEKASLIKLSKQIGRKVMCNGGSGTLGYRNVFASIK